METILFRFQRELAGLAVGLVIHFEFRKRTGNSNEKLKFSPGWILGPQGWSFRQEKGEKVTDDY